MTLFMKLVAKQFRSYSQLSDLITYIIESNPWNDHINEFDKTVFMAVLYKIKKNKFGLI